MCHALPYASLCMAQLKEALAAKTEEEKRARSALEASQRTEAQLRVEVATAGALKGELGAVKERSQELKQQVGASSVVRDRHVVTDRRTNTCLPRVLGPHSWRR